MELTLRFNRNGHETFPLRDVGAVRGIISASVTHAGTVRVANQDACLDRPEAGIWVVADGVGGSSHGERASGLVVDLLARIVPSESARVLIPEVRRQLEAAHLMLAPHASATTVVALLIHSGHFACLWAGDSRLYLLRGGTLHQVTKDHSAVQELIDAGLLTAAEARFDHRANIVTRAVGTATELRLDVTQARVELGDTFLLCSDGLSKVLTDGEIQDVLGGPDVSGVAERLIAEALARGATDNVTVVAVRVL